MPIYEYRCEGCGHRIEKLQSFSDDPLVHCPACDADLLKRLISQTSFHLKGAGWYVTDYKKGGASAPPPPTGHDAKGDGGDGPAAKSESAKSESGQSSAGKSESGGAGAGKSEPGQSSAGKGDPGHGSAGKSESGKASTAS